MHCVYFPDAILSICRMLLLLYKGHESGLCLYAGCHFVYMPDVVFAFKTKSVKVHCVYIPDVIRYMPDVTFGNQKGSESALCLYSGCHVVYMPDVTFC